MTQNISELVGRVLSGESPDTVIVTEGMGFTRKAKKGDYIQSFEVIAPVNTSKGSRLGKVTKVDVEDGVEYVYYAAEFQLFNGLVEHRVNNKLFRAIQNGQAIKNKISDGIKIVG